MTLKQSLLWPLTLPYGAVAHLRARAYRKGILKSQHLDGTVISVGNLTTGGTGKTPMVLWIAERLLAEQKNVGILTRGYRGEKIAPAAKKNSQAAASANALPSPRELPVMSQTCDILPPVVAPLHLAVRPKYSNIS